MPVYGQICKDKDEAEIWFTGLNALVTQGNIGTGRHVSKCDSLYSDSRTRRSPLITLLVCRHGFLLLFIKFMCLLHVYALL